MNVCFDEYCNNTLSATQCIHIYIFFHLYTHIVYLLTKQIATAATINASVHAPTTAANTVMCALNTDLSTGFNGTWTVSCQKIKQQKVYYRSTFTVGMLANTNGRDIKRLTSFSKLFRKHPPLLGYLLTFCFCIQKISHYL